MISWLVPKTFLLQEADQEVKFKRVGQPRASVESDDNESEKEERAEEANSCKKEQLNACKLIG